MKNIVFVTGNQYKFYEAAEVCKKFGIELEQVSVDIDEIQHHDSLKITEAKVRAAYEKIKKPVVVNDSSWAIPALGGFPGGYMKDVTSWFTEQDFLNLMRDKDDKGIELTDITAYYDGETLNMFTNGRLGHFVDEPRGESGWSLSRVVMMDADIAENRTISEIFDIGKWRVSNEEAYKHWYDFCKWYEDK